MHTFEIEFEILKDRSGKVIGFSLISEPHTESETFCRTFPDSFIKKKATIFIKDGKLIFSHPKCFYSGDHKVDNIDSDELNKIREIFEMNGEKPIKTKEAGKSSFEIRHAGSITPGFKFVKLTIPVS